MRTFFSVASRLPLLLLLAASMTLLLACEVEDPEEEFELGVSWAEALAVGEGTLEVLYVPAEGFAHEDEQGRLTGVTIDILREFEAWVEETYGVVLRLVFEAEEDWQTFYNRIGEAEEGIIGMGNVTITEERREEVSFSPAYMRNVAVLISHEDRPELTSFEEIPEVFAGHVALAFEGTLHEERLAELTEQYAPQMEMEFAHSNDEIIARVASEDRYIAYVDAYNYWRAQDRGLPLQRHEIGDDADEEFGYILPRNSDWQEPLDEFFHADDGFVESERYRQIMSRHLGGDLAGLLLDQQED